MLTSGFDETCIVSKAQLPEYGITVVKTQSTVNSSLSRLTFMGGMSCHRSKCDSSPYANGECMKRHLRN
ncbi:MAG: hypothetical protein U1E92_01365 [Moraxella osloensis]